MRFALFDRLIIAHLELLIRLKVLRSFSKKKDKFTPEYIISMLFWCYVPYLLIAKFYPEKYITTLLRREKGRDLEKKKISREFYFLFFLKNK